MAKRKSLFDNLGSFFDFYNTEEKKESGKPLTWSEFLKKIGDDIDKRLIAHAKKEGLVYVGGKCRLTVLCVSVADAEMLESQQNKDKFVLNVDAELYYKDQFKSEKNFQIYPLHTERNFEDFALDDEETKNQLEKLKTQQYEFNVETPLMKKEEG